MVIEHTVFQETSLRVWKVLYQKENQKEKKNKFDEKEMCLQRIEKELKRMICVTSECAYVLYALGVMK